MALKSSETHASLMAKSKDIEQKTDEELAGLTISNPDFYYFLMERYEEKILRYIRRISNVTKEAAEDLGQEIFLKAYENINDFDDSLKFSSWLYRIAHNHVISFWRKNKNEKNILSWDADESFKNMFESDDDIVEDLDKKMASKTVANAMMRLKENYREALVLRFMEDKDYAEISDIMEKPVGTIGTLILRAKKDLRQELLNGNMKDKL
jgi:RNA polymerase sigma-70 factor (ECF subfamily)